MSLLRLAKTKSAPLAERLAGVLPPISTDRRAYPLGYVASLDGVRGLMTLGVLVAHTRMVLFGGAMILMDVFFTMSGYLITSLLIADYEKRGKINLKKFYVRRFMRLYPALVAMLACLLAISWFFSKDFNSRLLESVFAILYLTDFAGFLATPLYYTSHMWSLAVEEQFYLLWPPVFILLLRFWGLSLKIVAVVFCMAAAFAIWRAYLTYSGAPIWRLYQSFDTRADALLVGCGLAIALKFVDFRNHPKISKALAWSLIPLAAVELLLCFFVNMNMRWYYYVSPVMGAIPGLLVTAALVQPTRTVMHRLYEHPILVYCGRICYGLYIWHYPIFIWLLYEWPRPALMVVLIGWPTAFAIATASYYLVERPFMRSRPL